jgi:flagellar assembly protein FliH
MTIAKQARVTPLSYAAMGETPAATSWGALLPEEDDGAHEQLAARIEQLQEEKSALAVEAGQRIAMARSEGYETGKREEAACQAVKAEQTRTALAAAANEFAAARDRYLALIEPEVVRLALAIAERVLHREAQMDPLLLAGAVRVALGKLSEATRAHLHVPPEESAMWAETLRLMPNLAIRPELMADAGLTAGECRLETELGSVDLGVRAQLHEIERGFFDLLEQRARVSHAAIA